MCVQANGFTPSFSLEVHFWNADFFSPHTLTFFPAGKWLWPRSCKLLNCLPWLSKVDCFQPSVLIPLRQGILCCNFTSGFQKVWGEALRSEGYWTFPNSISISLVVPASIFLAINTETCRETPLDKMGVVRELADWKEPRRHFMPFGKICHARNEGRKNSSPPSFPEPKAVFEAGHTAIVAWSQGGEYNFSESW